MTGPRYAPPNPPEKPPIRDAGDTLLGTAFVPWEGYRCEVCDGPFDEGQWFDRHAGTGGGEVHAECCPCTVGHN